MTAHKLRRILARRLDELMQATPALDTQIKLAERSGVAQSTIGRIIRCEVAPTLDNIEALAVAFGVSPCDLLRVDGAVDSMRVEDAAQLPEEGRALRAFLRLFL